MKAFVLTGFGRAPEFADVPAPEPGPGQIRVRVRATSVNPVDNMIRSGFFRAAQEYRFPRCSAAMSPEWWNPPATA